jgi:hypothetical protein
MQPIILIGRADCWKEDFERAKLLLCDFHVMAIGKDCPYEGEVKYFVTYHAQDISEYKKKRENEQFLVIGDKPKPGVDIIEKHTTGRTTGSSALLGASAAIRLGYTKIILCGCPLQGINPVNRFQPYEHFQKGWVARRGDVIQYVRSMSGWTRDFLGEPTMEWLET